MKGILLHENNDIGVTGSSLSFGTVDPQCAQLLVSAFTGEFKHAPTLGGNVAHLINGTPDPFWTGALKRQLTDCHVAVGAVEITTDGITIEIE